MIPWEIQGIFIDLRMLGCGMINSSWKKEDMVNNALWRYN